MKKKLFEALKAKFEGVSAAVLNRIVNALANTVKTEEDVEATVEKTTWADVVEKYGDSRASEASESAVSRYEQQHGLKDGVKINDNGGASDNNGDGQQGGGKPNTSGGSDETPAWAKALFERLDRIEGDRTTATRKQQLSEIYGKLPEKLRKPYERIRVDSMSDDDFNALKEELTAEVEDIVGDYRAKGAVFGRPAAQHGGTNKGDELTKEQVEAISSRTATPKDGDQPF